MLVASRKLSKLSLSNRMRVGGKADRRVLSLDLSMRSIRDIDTFTRASGDQWLDFDGNYRTAGINEEVYEGSRYLSPGVYSWFDLSGNLIPGIKLTTGPAVTNKCQTFGFVPDDEDDTTPVVFTSTPAPWVDNLDGTYSIDGTQGATTTLSMFGALTLGRKYTIGFEIVEVSAGGCSSGSGNLQAGLQSSVGVYPVTGILESGGNFSVSAFVGFIGTIRPIIITEHKYAVGTKSFHDGSVWVQNHGGITVSGDTAGFLETVDGSTRRDADGWGGDESNGKQVQWNNSAGVTDPLVGVITGDGGVTTDCTAQAVMYGSGDYRLGGINGGHKELGTLTGSFEIYSHTYTPTDVNEQISITAEIGATVNALLYGLYPTPYAPRQPVPASSLIASTTRSASLATLPVRMPQSFQITIEVTPDINGTISGSGGGRFFSTNDSRGWQYEVGTGSSTSYSLTLNTGGVTFLIDKNDVISDVESLYELSAKQNGANIDWTITKDDVFKGGGSVAGILDHSNQNSLNLCEWEDQYNPAQVKTIEVKAI